MTSVRSCPTIDELRTLHDASLSALTRQSLEDHLRGCEACLRLIADITASIPPTESTVAWIPETVDSTTLHVGVECTAATGVRGTLPQVPGYEITNEIGRGGMGVVYKARHIALNRHVALKTIRSASLADSRQLARFKTEAEALAQIQHPHIVQVFEIGSLDDTPFLTMEFVAGTTLDQAIATGSFTPLQSARCVEQLARAMFTVHQRGVLHRDLKPSNVLLTEDAQPKITDFGLAKFTTNDSQMTAPETVLGTPSYMPPEQAEGRNEDVGPRSDIYSLGAILYELLTGRPPFRGATPLETVQHVLQREPPTPRSLAAKTPRDLETICLKCLHKQPGGRYETAADLADDLLRFQRGEPIAARRVGIAGRTWRWCQRNRSLAAALAVICVAVIVGSGAVAWQRHQTEQARRATEQQYRRFTAEADEKFNLIEDLMQRLPEHQRAQDERLRSALNSYEQWLAEEPSGEAARASYADALFRVADIRRRIGQYEPAQAAYRRAVDQYRGLVAASPERASYRRGCAEALNWLGESFREAGQPAEAIVAYEDALLELRELAPQPQETLRCNVNIARATYNRALARMDLRQHADAEVDLRHSIEILEQLQGLDGRSELVRQSLARSHANLGILLRATERCVEAYQEYLQATMIYLTLTDDSPSEPEYRLERAVALNNLANLLLTDRRLGELKLADSHQQSRFAFENAVAILTELTQQFANVPRYRKELANSLNGLGALSLDAKEIEAAEQSWLSAAAELKALAGRYPEVAEYHALLAQTTFNLAYLSHQRQRVDERVGLLAEAIELQHRALALSPANVQYQQTLENYQRTAEKLNR